MTALSLHSDGGHFFANLVFGTVFGGFLAGRIGLVGGAFWVLVCGAVANGLNAFCHAGQPQVSVGASTAVFAALGLLAGGEACAGWRQRAVCFGWWWPLGAGLGLLAHLGVGEGGGRIDLMGHLLGFVVGLLAGSFWEYSLGGAKGSGRFDRWAAAGAALGAVLLFTVCWLKALGRVV